MAFHTNSSQQYSLTDITGNLTTHEKKALENDAMIMNRPMVLTYFMPVWQNFCGAENTALAASKNIQLVTTNLTVKDVPDIYADFELSKEGTRIVKRPVGYSPVSCCCSSSNGHIYASFSKEHCMSCPHKDECKAFARLRNGVETLPSFLRNLYHVDRMSVRGKIRSRCFFGCKIAALNICKLFTFRNGLGHYADNPLLVR